MSATTANGKPDTEDEKQDDLPPVKGVAHLDMLDRMSGLTDKQRRRNAKERLQVVKPKPKT